MTINTIKITQLVPIGTGLDANSTLPIVDLTGSAITRKTTAGNLANLILSSAGGSFAPAGQALTAQTVTNAAQPNITSVGTLSSLSVTGNTTLGEYVSATYFVGDLIGNVSNANYSNFAGTVTTNAQPNITSLGTLTGLDVTGNINALYADFAYFVTANYFVGDGGFLSNVRSLTANTVVDNAQPNITSLGTLTTLSVSGNSNLANVYGGNVISANYFVGDGSLLTNISVNALSITQIVNGTSSFDITTPNGNITANINGISNIAVFSQSGLSITGNLDISGTLNAVVSSAETANIANNVIGTVKVPFTYSTSSPLNLVQVSSGSTITEVSIIITTPFNGTNPSLSVGDTSNANRLFSTTDGLANEIGTYTVSPAYNYASTAQLILTINSGASTAGEGLLIISYE